MKNHIAWRTIVAVGFILGICGSTFPQDGKRISQGVISDLAFGSAVAQIVFKNQKGQIKSMEFLPQCGKTDTPRLDLKCTGDRSYCEKIGILTLVLTSQPVGRHDSPHTVDEEMKNQRDQNSFLHLHNGSKSEILPIFCVSSHDFFFFATNSSQSKNEKNSGIFSYYLTFSSSCLCHFLCYLH